MTARPFATKVHLSFIRHNITTLSITRRYGAPLADLDHRCYDEELASAAVGVENMQDDVVNGSADLVGLTSAVVAAYVSNNSVPRAELGALIGSVHAALAATSQPLPAQEARPEPPVPINKTIRPDYIVSLEDGRRYKSMKRHLSGRGLTPEQYRAKWGLGRDYPMVAPNYSKARSELAKALGLGQARKGRSGKTAAKKAKRS